MKSPHWTQTTEGKARMSAIQQSRKAANGNTQSAAQLAARTQIVLTINSHELTLTLDEARELMRLLSSHVSAPPVAMPRDDYEAFASKR